MARYTGPACRLCRREGTKLFLKGDRCVTAKCSIDRKNYFPGQHGPNARRKKETEYGIQLREKQKARRIYGLLERQFKNTFQKAQKKDGITGEVFLQMLEKRLDNVIYRLGFATSRQQARQFVGHNHVAVNGKKINLPSYMVKKGDVIEVRKKSLKKKLFTETVDRRSKLPLVSWLSWAEGELKGTVLDEPKIEDFGLPVKEQLIVEFYSK
ncbi:MAG: 30S ribosomal protein S4 [Nitrospinota bacterium]|nr:30S ribosomal protein S4 [Nitrospinota bacterium]